MGLEALLPFVDAPHPDAVLYKPLHHEGRLVRFAAQTVEHKHQQDIELALFGPLFDELQLVPVIGADLVAGHAGLLLLVHDDPAHFVGEVPAGFALDRDVRLVELVVVDLLGRGNTI